MSNLKFDTICCRELDFDQVLLICRWEKTKGKRYAIFYGPINEEILSNLVQSKQFAWEEIWMRNWLGIKTGAKALKIKWRPL